MFFKPEQFFFNRVSGAFEDSGSATLGVPVHHQVEDRGIEKRFFLLIGCGVCFGGESFSAIQARKSSDVGPRMRHKVETFFDNFQRFAMRAAHAPAQEQGLFFSVKQNTQL